MEAGRMTGTLERALAASNVDQAHMLHKPRLLLDNGPVMLPGKLPDFLADMKMGRSPRRAAPAADPAHDRNLETRTI